MIKELTEKLDEIVKGKVIIVPDAYCDWYLRISIIDMHLPIFDMMLSLDECKLLNASQIAYNIAREYKRYLLHLAFKTYV